jgi:hypothetical protein
MPRRREAWASLCAGAAEVAGQYQPTLEMMSPVQQTQRKETAALPHGEALLSVVKDCLKRQETNIQIFTCSE